MCTWLYLEADIFHYTADLCSRFLRLARLALRPRARSPGGAHLLLSDVVGVEAQRHLARLGLVARLVRNLRPCVCGAVSVEGELSRSASAGEAEGERAWRGDAGVSAGRAHLTSCMSLRFLFPSDFLGIHI